jgi:hypothetical protein
VHALHGTNLELGILDALNDFPGEPTLHGIGFDDGQGSLGHAAIITGANSATWQRGDTMTPITTRHQDDPAAHKGAIEGDRPTDKEQVGNPHGAGVDDQGLPNDLIATAEDAVGANEDQSQG